MNTEIAAHLWNVCDQLQAATDEIKKVLMRDDLSSKEREQITKLAHAIIDQHEAAYALKNNE